MLKNALSIQKLRNPNIELIRNNAKKGAEISPLNAESFGRNWIGPDKKNFVVPKEALKRLRRKVIRGQAWLMLS